MITARFQKQDERYLAFVISGHAGYADEGQDIVCASVTSAVQLTANAITEQFQTAAKVTVAENKISLRLPDQANPASYLLLEALHAHLSLISEEYEETIRIIVTEV